MKEKSMTKNFLVAVLASVCFVNICAAQSSGSQSVTNWGESVGGVQLSISLSNNIFVAGSAATVQCWVKNSSTNIIAWEVTEPTQGFVVVLTNSAGNSYRLTPEPDTNSETIIINYNLAWKVGAGATTESLVPIVIGENIKPGLYQLKAHQYCHIIGKRPVQEYELVSNPLEIQIK
jgi:hypothetical protein